MRAANEKNAILRRWRESLRERENDAAIVSVGGVIERTFAQIDAESRELEAAWDLAPGAVVGLQIGNNPSWPATLLALFRRGCIPLPLGRQMEQAERDVALRTCGVSAVIDGGLITNHRLPSTDHPRLPETCAFLKLTSGTTAAPRAICFTSEQLAADCDNVCDTMGITAHDLNFGGIPFSHSYGFSNLITPLLCRGVPLVATDERLPRAILDGLTKSGATVFPGMPVYFQHLGELNDLCELPRLRLCISAGAPLTKAVAERFTTRFGLKIHTFYGASECGGIGYDASDELMYEDGFAGTPMQRVDIEHRADSSIVVRSGAVGLGYFPEPDAAVLSEGRFVPADLVERTGRGMFIVGRSSDVINVAGRKLNPAEVEAHLLRLNGVRQAVVFGVPSALRHEEPVACIAANGLAPHDVLRFCHSVLSSWQVPKDVWLVDEIPINERGKISRRALARDYLERTAARE